MLFNWLSERQKYRKRCNGEGLPFPNAHMFLLLERRPWISTSVSPIDALSEARPTVFLSYVQMFQCFIVCSIYFELMTLRFHTNWNMMIWWEWFLVSWAWRSLFSLCRKWLRHVTIESPRPGYRHSVLSRDLCVKQCVSYNSRMFVICFQTSLQHARQERDTLFPIAHMLGLILPVLLHIHCCRCRTLHVYDVCSLWHLTV